MRRLAAGAGIGLVLIAGGVSPAGAHGGGAIELLDARPSGPLQIDLEVCVAYADEHQSGDRGEVTVRAEGPESAEVAAAPMTAEGSDGLHVATVEFPDAGSWTVVVESTNPDASLSVPVEVGADDRAAPGVASGGEDVGAACEEEPNESPTWIVAVLGGLAAVAVFGGLLWLMRRGGPAEDASER